MCRTLKSGFPLSSRRVLEELEPVSRACMASCAPRPCDSTLYRMAKGASESLKALAEATRLLFEKNIDRR
jgi:hypothetical protein